MRTRNVPGLLLTGLLMASTLTPLLAQQDQRQMGGYGMSVYEDANFRGRNATFIDDMPDLRQTGLDRRISSIRVAVGEVWQVCTERNYQGRCQVVSGTESNLQLNGWNDVIQSARRVQGGGGSGRGGGGRGGGSFDRPRPGTIELYAGTQYSGQREIVEQAEPNLRRFDFNDRASSLRVAAGEAWEVCVNQNYDDCRLVDEDMPTLNQLGLNREISSVRPRPNWGGGIGRGGRGGPRPQAILYDQANYRGRSIILAGEEPRIQLTSNSAGSLRIISGRWELCVQPGFSGRCVTVNQNVPDIRRLSLPGRVSSARPR
jgi:hypothetical protein